MDMKMEREYPHAPDVLERETSDGGFSAGWGMHFQPMPERIADMHGHIEFDDLSKAEAAVNRHMELMRPLNVTHCVACSPVMERASGEGGPQGFSVRCLAGIDALRPYLQLARASGRLSLMLFLHYANPDAELLKLSAAEGVCAVKLHNAPIIVNAGDPECWLSGEWAAVFSELERLGLPVLWHVTQRLTGSPYTGGGRNTYWKDGWKKGVAYTNEDLLRIYLQVVEKYPRIPFISAHQLHLGWERLGRLFDRHPNLHADTSIGCWVNEGDRMYGNDVRRIREFFIKYHDRMLFGTDYFITDRAGDDTINDGTGKTAIAKSHIRFVRQLRLPDEALQDVMHANAERLLKV